MNEGDGTRRFRGAILLPLAVACLYWSIRITAPFIFPHEANNAIYSLAAKNHLELGLAATRGSNLLEITGDGSRTFYHNHPGVLSLLVAAVFSLLGDSEIAARTLPILFSSAGLVLLYRAVRARWGGETALASTLIAALYPMTACYGKMINFEPLILPLGILLLDEIGRNDGPSPQIARRRIIVISAAAAAAGAIDYGALLLIPALIVLRGVKRTTLAASIAILGVTLLHFAMIAGIDGPHAVSSLFAKGAERAGASSAIPLLLFARHQLFDYYVALFTPTGACLALIGIFCLDRGFSDRTRFVVAVLVWGAGYVALFRQAAEIHEYWQYYLIPASAILVGIALSRVHRAFAVVLVGFMLYQSVLTVVHHYYGDTGWYALEFRAIDYAREHGSVGDVVLTSLPMRTWHPQYYTGFEFRHDPTLTTDFEVRSDAGGYR